MRRASGFTLVELLVSIAILALLSTVALPALSNLLDVRGVAAVGCLRSDLEFVRGLALASGRPHRAVFDLPGNRYRLEQWSATEWVPLLDPLTHRPAETRFDVEPHFQGIQLTAAVFGDQPVVSFDADGSPSAAGSATLVSGAREYRVEVSNWGLVNVVLPED